MNVLGFRARLMLITLGSTIFALTLSGVGLAFWQYSDARRDLEAHNRQLADVLAATASAPVVFQDRAAIQEAVMTAGRLDPARSVIVLDRKRQVLAANLKPGFVPVLPAPAYDGVVRIAWRGPAMRIVTPILVDNDIVGWLDMTVLGESLAHLAARVARLTAALLVIASAVAVLVARRLLKIVFDPIDGLLETMETITVSANYAIRVPVSKDPEVDRVLAAFNMMIAEVERREGRLANTMGELERARDAAESANVAKSQFIASMSHELRTPLNAVIGYAELVMEDLEASDPGGHVPDLRVINNSAQHLLVLINQVLDFATIESGQTSLDPQLFSLEALARDVATTLKPVATKNGNVIELTFDDATPPVFLDMTKLRQCLLNLAANACKFTENGRVLIQSQYLPQNDRIRIAITDTGIGMSPNLIARLFTPFSQADASATRKYGGTGLGLVITDEFVRLMGGAIDVSSTLGSGSTFTIDLPRRLPTAPGERALAGANLPRSTPLQAKITV